jgi:hypothetical protein
MVYEGLNPGDETRRNGDYVGLPHDQDAGGTADVDEGQLVAFDGTNIVAVDDTSAEDVFGVLYTYQYAGDSGGSPQPDSNIVQDRDATVKTSGTAIADLSGMTTPSSPSAGDVLGPNGEVLVLQASDSGTDHFEVLLR